MESRLILGTAQLGMNYGIANFSGKPDRRTASSIIKTAAEYGVLSFDTAQSYGDSEKILGDILHLLGLSKDAIIYTKIHPKINLLNIEATIRTLEQTLLNLKIHKVFALLIHKEEMLDKWNEGLCETFEILIRLGMVDNIGVSVYSPERASQALSTNLISIVQIPSNLLDRRFEKNKIFEKANALKKQIVVRSVFLQGLLLMEIEAIPEKMQFTAPVLKKVDEVAREMNLSKSCLSLGYAKCAYPHAKIVFGAEKACQITDNISCWNRSYPADMVSKIRSRFDQVSGRILNPSKWNH